MKTIGVILFLALIVALFTVPSRNKFNNYLVKKGKDVGMCFGANSTRHQSYKVFSLDYVDYCDPVSIQNGTLNLGLSKKRTDQYLGIFGMFFKL